MQDPKIIVKVFNDIRREANRIRANPAEKLDPHVRSAETQAVVNLSRKAGATIETITTPQQTFFERHATGPARFLDIEAGLTLGKHGATTHMVQDLVVDEALRRAGSSLRADTFRTLLGNGDAHAREVLGNIDRARVGRFLWGNVLHDAPHSEKLHRPEAFFQLLRFMFPDIQ
jgi:hypothetical protein